MALGVAGVDLHKTIVSVGVEAAAAGVLLGVTDQEQETIVDLVGALLDQARWLRTEPPKRAKRAEASSFARIIPEILDARSCERHRTEGGRCVYCLHELCLRQAIEIRKLTVRNERLVDRAARVAS